VRAFGTGRGAAVLQKPPEFARLLTAVMGADGGSAKFVVQCPAAAAVAPPRSIRLNARLALPADERPGTYKARCRRCTRGAGSAVAGDANSIFRQIKCIIPHQANRRIIDAVGERLGRETGADVP